MVSVNKGALLIDALKVFVDTSARRVAILENGEMVNILTQSGTFHDT